MIPRLTRIVGSLAIVITMYWTYALAVVPFIEPSTGSAAQVKLSDSDIEIASRQHENQVKALEGWFAEGDWERTSPKVLETAQGMLLVKNYRNLGEGRVEIIPCTMIFLPEGNFESEEERQRRAIVLRSPQGAILQFEAFDLKQAKVGKLIAGKLMGPVTIRSDQRERGPQDDLLIRTSDVDLTEQKLVTNQPVQYQLGPNYGHGHAMRIDMAPQGSKRGFRGMTFLELSEHVEMHIQPSGADLFPGRPKDPGQPKTKKTNPPVEIRCRGPFRFDFLKNVATFEDSVDVLRINQAGPSDQLTCQKLSLLFEVVPPKPGEPARTERTAPNLQPVTVMAEGSPVVINAPANDLHGRGEHLDYNIKTGAAKLRGEPEAQMQQAGREVHARELFYQPEAGGRIGQFIATGAGWVRGDRPEDKTQTFSARWSRRLYFRPYQGQSLLSIEGNAEAQSVGKGMIRGEEIHLWLRDAKPSSSAAAEKQSFTPDRLLAVGHVTIDSPQLTGAVGQLQAWFEAEPKQPAPTVVRRPPYDDQGIPQPLVAAAQASPPMQAPPLEPPPAEAGAPTLSNEFPGGWRAGSPGAIAPPLRTFADPAGAPVPRGGPPPVEPVAAPPADRAPAQRFHIEGELLRLRVQMQNGSAQLSEAFVEHHVRLTETQTRQTSDKRLLVTGDQMHLVQTQPQDGVVTVAGNPAYVEARGMTLSSPTIHLNRGQNTLWTDSEGGMTLPVDRDMEGRAAQQPEPLSVLWRGQMRFDGRMARFERHVVARHGLQTMTTDVLDVALSGRVEFGNASSHERPQVERVICRQGVFLENRTVEAGKLTSIDRLEAVELTLHQPTGDIAGQGPGWLRSARIDSGQGPGAGGGLPGGLGAPPGPPKPKPNGPRLVYLGVNFQRSLSGNMRRREMTFENQVRAIYGPVPQWEAQLDPDRPETWGEDGVMLTSERLGVLELPSGGDARSYELEATGNTLVENTAYTARAHRLTFSQAKDLLILEGSGRSDARLFRQLRVGAAPSEAAAQKIYFWPKSNRVEVDGARMIDFINIPQK